MKRFKLLKEALGSFLGAIVFYTMIPLPDSWLIDLRRIARWSPLVGLILGTMLSSLDYLLEITDCPRFLSNVLIVAFWLIITGGLHLDGVIDSADGLAVPNRNRRLEAMRDSNVGAFGVMAVILLLLLKISSLVDLHSHRALVLILSASWGRWGQLFSIASFPYLRAEGKGAFHKTLLKLPEDLVLPLVFLIVVSLSGGGLGIVLSLMGLSISSLVGWWFFRQFNGHTGDTYGAVVEWSEAIFLAMATILMRHIHQ